MTRKAQVTMFIIIGLIVLLAGIIGYVAFENELIFKPPEEQVTTELETQLRPFANVVEECQQRILQEGAKKLLKKGGYLDNPALVSTLLPLGNSVQLGGSNIPYWHYIDSGISASERPELQSDSALSISTQIADYVDERLTDCVPWDNFAEYSIEYGKPDTEISFTDEQTTAVTNWQVKVSTPAGEKSYSAFTASSDAPVKHLYEVAEEQIRLLSEARMPETNLLRMLSIYATGRDALPPLQGTVGFLDSYKLWPLAPAREDLQEVIGRTTDFMQVYGSDSATLLTGEDQVVTNIQLDNLLLSSFDVTNTRIKYFNGPQEVYYTVDDNPAVAMPEYVDPLPLIGGLLPPLADTNFQHDITYPLLMSVSQDDYELIVGYEANIRANVPQRGAEDEQIESENLCDTAGGTKAHITIERLDEADIQTPVDVVFECGGLTCPLGSAYSEMQTQLPTCVAGNLQAYHADLFSDSVDITSLAGDEQEIELTLYEPAETTIQIMGREVVADGENYTLAETEVPVAADMIFIRQGSPYVVQTRPGETVNLVPGTYDILAIEVVDFDPELVIPEEEFCAQGECATINETSFESLPTVYLEASDVRINQIPETITLIAANLPTQLVNSEIEIIGLDTFEDLGLLSGLFDLRPEEFIRFE